MNKFLHFATTIYSLLLRLYPKTYREKFAEEMLMDFSDLLTDAGRKGWLSLMIFCVRELVDFPINLLRTHLGNRRVFRLLRLQPINFGLRGALAYGVVFLLGFPMSIFVNEKLFFWLYPMVTRLQVLYFDTFHAERGFDWILWIPSVISSLLTGLLLGIMVAFLFGDRSRYRYSLLVGMFGWLTYHLVNMMLVSFNFAARLDNNQFIFFDYLILAYSGAILGFVFAAIKSEKRNVLRWLALSIFLYPLFTYLWIDQLLSMFPLSTTWRFIGVLLWMIVLIASVFVAAIRLQTERKLPRVLIAGTFGFPFVRLLMMFFVQSLSLTTYNPNPSDMTFIITNALYGILLGLVLGAMMGFEKQNDRSPRT